MQSRRYEIDLAAIHMTLLVTVYADRSVEQSFRREGQEHRYKDEEQTRAKAAETLVIARNMGYEISRQRI